MVKNKLYLNIKKELCRIWSLPVFIIVWLLGDKSFKEIYSNESDLELFFCCLLSFLIYYIMIILILSIRGFN